MAGLKRTEIDGVLCGYNTIAPHIMLATVFAEHFRHPPELCPCRAGRRRYGAGHDHAGAPPRQCRRGQARAGRVRRKPLTGQSRDAAIQALAQVGHPDYEVSLGPTIPPIMAWSPPATCMNTA